MNINISREVLLSEIKKEFTNTYPYLKMDFKIPENKIPKHSGNKGSVRELSVGDILNNNPEGTITIEDDNSIKSIAQIFLDHFGIETMFYRKSGNLWLEIKLTNEWSLKQQNQNGMEVF